MYLFVSVHAQASIDVYFSPEGGCTDAIVRELKTVKKTLYIQAYGFSSAPIAEAVIEAKSRGVDVGIVLDKSNERQKYTSATYLSNHDIIVMIDYIPRIAHSKVMILDNETIITGSFNFTKAAEHSNVENLLIIRNEPELVKKYIANFKIREQLSRFYKGIK